MALDLSVLTNWVSEQRLPLIKKVVVGATSVKYFTIQTGIKSSAALNILSTDVQLGDGNACGFSDISTDKFSQRKLDVAVLKSNKNYCDSEMLALWTQNQVNVAAGKNTLGSFEADFIDGLIGGINMSIEKGIYQGDSASSDNNLKMFGDGLLKILAAETAVIVPTIPAGTSIVDAVNTVFLNIPNDAFRRGNVIILMGTDVYRKYILELVKLDWYHYNPSDSATANEYIHPGTSIKVAGVEGLDGTNKVIATSEKNLFYGTNLEDDSEVVRFWFSDDEDLFKSKVKWTSGVQVGFPDEVVLATIL